MLWGSQRAKVDEKHRLKIPASFRRDLPETEDSTYFVTSDNRRCAQIYPLPIWEQVAQKFMEPPRFDPAKQKLEKITSYYGLITKIDPQGRILIPQVLRVDAELSGEVIVIAKTDHLEVWNNENIRKSLDDEPLTVADRERLAEMGF